MHLLLDPLLWVLFVLFPAIVVVAPGYPLYALGEVVAVRLGGTTRSWFRRLALVVALALVAASYALFVGAFFTRRVPRFERVIESGQLWWVGPVVLVDFLVLVARQRAAERDEARVAD